MCDSVSVCAWVCISKSTILTEIKQISEILINIPDSCTNTMNIITGQKAMPSLNFISVNPANVHILLLSPKTLA